MTENQRQPTMPLVRSRDKRVLVGVCGGLGRYTNVDPVVYRVVLALLAFASGIGILLYAAGWLLIPEEGSSESVIERLLHRRFDAAAVPALLVAALGVVLALSLFSHGFGSPTIVLVTIVAMAALVAHRNGVDLSEVLRGIPGRLRMSSARASAPEAPPSGPAPPSPGGPSGMPGEDPPTPPPSSVPLERQEAPSGAHDAGQAAPGAAYDPGTPYDPGAPRQPGAVHGPDPPLYPGPAYGPHGASEPYGPGASYEPGGPYDLTALYHPAGAGAYAPTSEHGRRQWREPSFLTPVALAVAAIVAGVLAALSTTGTADVTLQVALAAVLLVIGLGLVLGTWYGRGRSLLLVGTALCLALVTATAVSIPLRGGVGDVTWRPTGAVAGPYNLAMGDAALDLTGLPARGPHAVTASVGVGELRVRVPRDAKVVVRAHAGTGDIAVAGGGRGGIGVDLDRVLAPAGTTGASTTITLNLRVGVGGLVVTRAAS